MNFLFPYPLPEWRRRSADHLEKSATTRRKDAGSPQGHVEHLSLMADTSSKLCVSVNILFVKLLGCRQSINTDCFIYPNQSAYRMNFMASVSSSLKKGYYPSLWASQVAHGERICLPMHETQETLVWSLVEEDHMQDGIATPSSILVWKIPCKEPGGLQSMGSKRVAGNLSAKQQQKFCYIWHSFLSLSYILRLHLKPKRNLFRAPYTVTDKHCQDQEDTSKWNCIASQAFCFCIDLKTESKPNNKASEKATFSKLLFMCAFVCLFRDTS